MRLFRGRGRSEEIVEDDGPQPTVSEVLLLPQPSDTLLRWAKSGYLRQIMPDLDALRGVSQMPGHKDDAFIHTLKAVDSASPTLIRRWSALLHDIGKGPTYLEAPDGRSRFFEHDKFGTEMVPEIMRSVGEEEPLISQVRRLVSLHMRPISYRPDWTDGAVKRLYDEATEGRGPEGWDDLLALSRADLGGYRPEPIDRGLWVLDSLEARYKQIIEDEERARAAAETEARSPLTGDEILALDSRDPGAWVGELKDFLCREVERGTLSRDDKASAEQMARRWLQTRFDS